MVKSYFGQEEKELVRLNKYLSEAGVCSRREADKLVDAGRVTVDGERAVMGLRVSAGQDVRVDGNAVIPEEEEILLAVNKPVGIICTTEKKWGSNNIEEFLNYPKRVFSIGRLDKDSEGLLLMTNNGDILNKIMRAGNYHEKEYMVTVNHPVTDSFIRQMSEGVGILETVTRPCEVEKLGKCKFRIVLTQGLNRQIRRMSEVLGYKVIKLVRVRIMNVQLGKLQTGGHRKLTDQEKLELYQMLEASTNQPEFLKNDREV